MTGSDPIRFGLLDKWLAILPKPFTGADLALVQRRSRTESRTNAGDSPWTTFLPSRSQDVREEIVMLVANSVADPS